MKYFLYSILLIFSHSVYAQEQINDNWIVFNSLNSPIDDSRVYCVKQDKNQDYWFLCAGSLHSYNGSDWESFNLDSIASAEYANAQDMAIDDSGNIWIAADELLKYDGKSWTVYNDQNSPLLNNDNWAVHIARSGDLWIGSTWDGIVRFDGTEWHSYYYSDIHISIDHVDYFAEDNDGWIYMLGIRQQINFFNDGNWYRLFDILGIDTMSYDWSLWGLEPEGDTVWMSGLEERGPITYIASYVKSDSVFTFYHKSEWGYEHFEPTPYRNVAVDTNNIKWFGGTNGILRFDGTEWSIFDSTNSPFPPGGNVVYSAVDNKNNKIFSIWNHWSRGPAAIGVYFYNENGVDIMSISDKDSDVPDNFTLFQNYPNPFNSETTIRFNIPGRSYIKLALYDITGSMVKIIDKGERDAGSHYVNLDVSDLSSGIYFYRLITPKGSLAKKMILMK